MDMKKILLLACMLVGGLTAHAQGYTKTQDREAVPFEKMKGSMVLFTFGQSNSANFGQRDYRYTCKKEVYNYFNDTIYKAKDPLLGADGGWASVWTLVGDKLIEKCTPSARWYSWSSLSVSGPTKMSS